MHIPFLSKRRVITNPLKDLRSTKELRRRISKILFIDDEAIEIVQDIRNLGYNANLWSDIHPENIAEVERGEYQIIFLDFAGVGKKYGNQEGLGILRHLKKVAPSVFIVSFTSKAIKSEYADFYILADTNIGKDKGIGAAHALIDDALEQVYSPDKLWTDINKLFDIDEGKKQELAMRTQKAVEKKDFSEVFGLVANLTQNEQVRALATNLFRAAEGMLKA